jgi:stringent starvation protein B
MRVVVPINAVLAIYARENGEGTVFTAEEFVEQSDDFDVQIEQTNAPVDDKKPEEKPVSHLKVIK